LDADFHENGGIVPAETAIATFTIFCYLPDLIFGLIFFIRLGASHLGVALWPGSARESSIAGITLRVGKS